MKRFVLNPGKTADFVKKTVPARLNICQVVKGDEGERGTRAQAVKRLHLFKYKIFVEIYVHF